VAVTWIAGRLGAWSRVVAHGWSPRASPPSRLAPGTVVRTTPADGSRARPALSRLSPWRSWLSSTASIGGGSAAAIAGPVSFRDIEPQPKEYRPPGGRRAIGQQPPPADLDQRGRPADVDDADGLAGHQLAGVA
jgi:hypothetical protein